MEKIDNKYENILSNIIYNRRIQQIYYNRNYNKGYKWKYL